MADVTPTITRIVTHGALAGYNVAWAGLTFDAAPNISGVRYTNIAFADRSVQVTGTFGVGGRVLLQGSNDGTNWVTLNDPQANALSFTAAGLEAVLELTQYIRPTVNAGDGTTSLTVTMTFGGRR